MASSTSRAFPVEGLETNRSGALTDQQRKGFRAWSRSNHRSALSSAAFLVAGSALILFFASPTAPPVARVLFPAIALAIAGFLIVRAVLGGVDALSRDLSESRVESAEGAIGKRFRASRGAQNA